MDRRNLHVYNAQSRLLCQMSERVCRKEGHVLVVNRVKLKVENVAKLIFVLLAMCQTYSFACEAFCVRYDGYVLPVQYRTFRTAMSACTPWYELP